MAVAHGLANARTVLDRVKSGESDYHFIEIMCCPGGCVGGGGQPILTADERWEVDYREARGNAIYDVDRSMTLRKSHENPAVQTLYKEFLEKPLGEKSHKLLHTCLLYTSAMGYSHIYLSTCLLYTSPGNTTSAYWAVSVRNMS